MCSHNREKCECEREHVFRMTRPLDLADALKDLVVQEKVPTTSSCDTTDVQRNTFRLEDGLELVVSKNPRTLCRNAVVVLAATRWKKLLGHKDKKSWGVELLSSIFGYLVEETIVKTTVNWALGYQTFKRSDSNKECTLSDLCQKSFVLESEQMELQAVCLKGGYEDQKVKFTLSRYEPPAPSGGQTVLLSIKDYHLSCSMKNDRAVLVLEKCSKENLDKISDEANMHRFLFWKQSEGTHLDNKFESVSCPGWFISTSQEPERPVDMCRADDQRHMLLRTA